MEKKKVLYIAQEITPYLPETEMSIICRYLPQGIQERGMEIRAFMPRFGLINERRNQLHEVIRLSGMNLIIDDTDHPLIIKVASIQSARMQVYFIDNEDYFHRKFMLSDTEGAAFTDNDERAVFFARGVIETVRKLRWAPDIIHCHGWITFLVPLYIKKAFADDPLFANSKIVYSIYNDGFDMKFEKNYKDKVKMDGVSDKDFAVVESPDFINTSKLAIKNADGIIMGNENVDPLLVDFVKKSKKPILEHQSMEDYIDSYAEFYKHFLD